MLRAAAVGYPMALLLLVVALRWIGERWWVTTVALYVPRHWLALPLPVLSLALLLAGERRLLVTQLAAGWIVLFPLMGLRLGTWTAPTESNTRIRVLSMNIRQGAAGIEGVQSQLHVAGADIVLLQDLGTGPAEALPRGLKEYRIHVAGEFLLASRYPIEDVYVPAWPPQGEVPPAYVRYRLTLPDGPVDVFNVHPFSPRDALEEFRGRGSQLRALLAGRYLRLSPPPKVVDNTRLRLSQLRAIAAEVERSPRPVIIAGDTNFPGLSWALAHWFAKYQDGFHEAGMGFGYTYPVGKSTPWLRIDRILTGDQFRFVRFEVLESGGSDHRGVLADIEPVAR